MVRFGIALPFFLSVSSVQSFQTQTMVGTGNRRIETRQSKVDMQRNVSSSSNPDYSESSLSDALNSVTSAARDQLASEFSVDPDDDEAQISQRKQMVERRRKAYRVQLPLTIRRITFYNRLGQLNGHFEHSSDALRNSESPTSVTFSAFWFQKPVGKRLTALYIGCVKTAISADTGCIRGLLIDFYTLLVVVSLILKQRCWPTHPPTIKTCWHLQGLSLVFLRWHSWILKWVHLYTKCNLDLQNLI